MDVPSSEPRSETEADRFPLLMEQRGNNDASDHVIDILRANDASSCVSHDNPPGVEPPQHENRPSSSTRVPTYQTSPLSSNRLNARNSSFIRTNEEYDRRRRSPLNSRLWISVELVVIIGQIIASVVVLSLSAHDNPEAPLFSWVVGYASGCVAMLPILYWRYHNCNQGTEQDSTQLHQGLSQSNPSSEPASYTSVSVTRASEEENQQTTVLASTNSQSARSSSSCLNGLVDHFKMALDCFFAVWFVVGNVWLFGGHSSPSDAPKLYRLCMVFLTFSCIGYAMPFILCATICCCLPCIISALGLRGDVSQTRGATLESINALPTYKFKKIGDDQDIGAGGGGGGGILVAGTERKRAVSGEDAACCICLAKYAEDDELRELPCSHFFHVECVDKWLKINASCPLCKSEVGESSGASHSTRNSIEDQNARQVDNGSTGQPVYGSTVF